MNLHLCDFFFPFKHALLFFKSIPIHPLKCWTRHIRNEKDFLVTLVTSRCATVKVCITPPYPTNLVLCRPLFCEIKMLDLRLCTRSWSWKLH